MRIAVLGSGISGSFLTSRLGHLCPSAQIDIYEMGRGSGGRLSGRNVRIPLPPTAVPSALDGIVSGNNKAKQQSMKVNHGAPAFDIKSPAFQDIVDELVKDDLVSKWEGVKLGTFGFNDDDQGGECAADNDIQDTSYILPPPSQTSTLSITDHTQNNSPYSLYKPNPKLCDILISSTPKATLKTESMVTKITQNGQNKWSITTKDGTTTAKDMMYDWLVVSGTLAGHETRWKKLFGDSSVDPLSEFRDSLGNDVTHDSSDVKVMKDVTWNIGLTDGKPILTYILIVKGATAHKLEKLIDFDMIHIKNSPIIGKLIIQPGGKPHGDSGEYMLPIVVHSTPSYAGMVGDLKGKDSVITKILGNKSGDSGGGNTEDKSKNVEGEIKGEFMRILRAYSKERIDIDANDVEYSALHRWGSAFPYPNPYFSNPESPGDFPVVNNGFKFAVVGDFGGDVKSDVARVEGAVVSADKAARVIGGFINGVKGR